MSAGMDAKAAFPRSHQVTKGVEEEGCGIHASAFGGHDGVRVASGDDHPPRKTVFGHLLYSETEVYSCILLMIAE